jgi:hypothetical protein
MAFLPDLKRDPDVADGEPVLVIWDDAWSRLGIGGSKKALFEAASRKHYRYTIGWLIGKDDKHLIVCSTCDPPGRALGGEDPYYEDLTRIRRDMVEKVVPLCKSPSNSRSTRRRRSSSRPSLPSQPVSECSGGDKWPKSAN